MSMVPTARPDIAPSCLRSRPHRESSPSSSPRLRSYCLRNRPRRSGTRGRARPPSILSRMARMSASCLASSFTGLVIQEVRRQRRNSCGPAVNEGVKLPGPSRHHEQARCALAECDSSTRPSHADLRATRVQLPWPASLLQTRWRRPFHLETLQRVVLEL